MRDGGPAFPVPTGSGFVEGMTLRDYFAAHALKGFLASGMDWEEADGPDDNYPVLAKHAYAMADAMLAAREAKS